MKKVLLLYSLAVGTGVALVPPAEASAQVTAVPERMLPPRGLCRIWVPGRSLNRQPPVMDCAQAQRLRSRYGSRAFVVVGNRVVSRPGAVVVRPGDARRVTRTYVRTINGRRCRVVDTYVGDRRVDRATVCEHRPSQDRPHRPDR